MQPRRIEDRLARRGGVLELLRIPALAFAGLARLRNGLYDRGLLPRARLGASVISVGNLTTGGTGKTPLVAWLAEELARRGRRVGILSRGYGRGRDRARNDEGELLARLVPGVPHVQDPDRVAGGLELESRGCDAILLDDGFQHRRLARDLDLVLIDATQPWGLPARDGRAAVRSLLPRGLLRESPAGLARADAVLLTRADQVEERELERLEAELQGLAPGKPLLRAAHRPSGLRRSGPDGQEQELPCSFLAGRPVVLLSGLGNPAAFERSARALGADVRAVQRFGDHHRYDRAEVQAALRDGCELLVSAKDAVKLAALGVSCLVLEVRWQFLRGASVLDALLDALPLPQAVIERRALHEGLHG